MCSPSQGYYQPVTPYPLPTVFLEPDGAPYCMPRQDITLAEAIRILTKAGRRLTGRMAGHRTWRTDYVN